MWQGDNRGTVSKVILGTSIPGWNAVPLYAFRPTTVSIATQKWMLKFEHILLIIFKTGTFFFLVIGSVVFLKSYLFLFFWTDHLMSFLRISENISVERDGKSAAVIRTWSYMLRRDVLPPFTIPQVLTCSKNFPGTFWIHWKCCAPQKSWETAILRLGIRLQEDLQVCHLFFAFTKNKRQFFYEKHNYTMRWGL